MAWLKHFEHALKIMPPAQHASVHGADAVGALLGAGLFFDAVERRLAGAAINAKQRPIRQRVKGVIAPLPRRHHLTVKTQQTLKLGSVKEDGASAHVEGRAPWLDGGQTEAVCRVRKITNQNGAGYCLNLHLLSPQPSATLASWPAGERLVLGIHQPPQPPQYALRLATHCSKSLRRRGLFCFSER